MLKVKRSSYYKWLERKITKNELENHELAHIITEYHDRFNQILGYRRMTSWINKFNHKKYNKKRVRRLMKQLGIKSIIRRKKSKYIKSKPEITAENLLNRDFHASMPNEKWATDVTEFKVIGSTQKVYLSAIIDLYDRSIVSYILNTRNDNNLVFKTYDAAMEKYPNATPLFHSDRGFQYTSKVFRTKLEEARIVQSMSRVGRCIDNGPMEGFWGIIKEEMYALHKFHSMDDLKIAIHEYIDFYNNRRLQSRFHDQTPIEVRNQALQSETCKQYPIPENSKTKKYYQSFKVKNNDFTSLAFNQ